MQKLFLLPFVLLFVACFDDDLIIIEAYSELEETKGEYIKELNDFLPDLKEVNIIKITSNTDSVNIGQIVVNRGNCKLKNPLKKEVDLKFGKSLFFKHNCTKVLEVDVDINGSTYTYQFN